ncbi:glycerophosphodiester phosphodiesterase family protein [Leuconostoc rapi]|uniref:glycerophosphodiester phosphodiesterase family protein n=1 Tax=Leuconostoc rapi TaxID=1406906 RepID=UPI00195C0DEA|nr:glycerophosphodiester phosphodiesterase family protein [Leuconostoc rapi]MBM7435823.1 glycerophosphoryl diester phosphodiesterase [Leuconostoc rapi]
MQKIAHRGISAQAPENTRAAFEKMVNLGVDWLETDIDMTSDGQLVLIHDSKVDRTSNGNGLVNHNSLLGLQKLDFGQWFGDEFTDERIVTLQWLIDFINAHALNVNFELKTEVKHEQQNFYLMRVHQSLHQLNQTSQVIVSSFDVDLLKKYHELMPKIPIGLLIEGELPNNIIELAKNVGATYIHPDVTYMTEEQVKLLLSHDLQVNVWTVNEAVVAKKLQKWGVHAIFTDFPV